MTTNNKYSGVQRRSKFGIDFRPVLLCFYQLSSVGLVGITTIVTVETMTISATQAATLTSWRFDPVSNQLEVNIKEGTTPRFFLITQPTRIVLDLPNTKLEQVASQQTYSGAIRQVRTAQFEENVVRIVLELSPGVALAPELVQLQQPQPGNNERWILRPLIAAASQPTVVSPSPTQTAVNPVIPPLDLPSTTLPPATTNNQQPVVVSVPPLVASSPTTAARSNASSTPVNGEPVISFGEPLPVAPSNPTSPQGSLPRLQPGALLPEEISSNSPPTQSGNQSLDVFLPASTQLNVRYAGNVVLNLKAGTPQPASLLLVEDVRSPGGNLIAPTGTPVIGRFETDRQGIRFIAQAIALQDQNVPLAAQSDVLNGSTTSATTLQPGQVLQIRLTEDLTKLRS